MAPCRAMICHQVTLSGDAEWPKVADAVIEARGRAINNAAFGRDHAPPRVTFAHLGDPDVTPRAQPRSPTLPGRHGIAKSLTHGPDGGAEAIGTDQQRTGRRTAAHALR